MNFKYINRISLHLLHYRAINEHFYADKGTDFKYMYIK